MTRGMNHKQMNYTTVAVENTHDLSTPLGVCNITLQIHTFMTFLICWPSWPMICVAGKTNGPWMWNEIVYRLAQGKQINIFYQHNYDSVYFTTAYPINNFLSCKNVMTIKTLMHKKWTQSFTLMRPVPCIDNILKI